jgi:hypothetical protein
MTLSALFLSPANQMAVNVNGRSYTVTGATITIPYPDALAAAAQLTLLQIQGLTIDRPVFSPTGNGFGVGATSVPARMFDQTLGEMIFNSGASPTVWVNAAGSVV